MKNAIRIAASIAVVLCAGSALAGEEVDEAAMMAAWQKSMTPGQAHKDLAANVGDWTYVSRMWMEPGAPPMESNGKSTIEALMGGRYTSETVQGNVMGMPMEGMSITGFNNVTGMYETIWIDNMGTGIMTAQGTKDGNVITMTGTTTDPMGNPMQVKMVTTQTDKDHYTFAYYSDGNGEMTKVMEMAYTRAASAEASGD